MIPLGVQVDGSANPVERITFLKERGFESFSLSFWQHTGAVDLERLADEIAALGIRLSSLSVYGNVLSGDESAEGTARAWRDFVRLAPRFGTDLVSGFAGRIPGTPVDRCIDAWKGFFSPLLENAGRSDVRLAFENCRMGGTWKTGNWNIAINPDAWALMEAALPSASWGIEWEPGHAVLGLADPHVQLESCVSRVLHVHGKDGSVDAANLARNGCTGSAPSGTFRYPGFGDCDWKRIFSILDRAGYGGTVDIECGHDPVYCGDREDEGLMLSREYLDSSRRPLAGL